MNQDFLDLLRAFVEAEVRFMLVGAYALAFHGQPRTTGDLDVWIDATPDNGIAAYGALAAFGAPMHELDLDDLTRPGVVFQMGVEPFRVDILTQISGVTFEEAWPDRVVQDVSGLPVPFIGREAFIRNKRASGRPQDLLDVRTLEES